jgi:hypothetical protein
MRRRDCPYRILTVIFPVVLVAGQVADVSAQGPVPAVPTAIQPYGITATYATNAPTPALPVSTAPSYAPLAQSAVLCPTTSWCSPDGFFAGADYLLLRTHFSQAIGFVQVTDSLSGGLPHESVQAREINFPYSSGFRTYLGYNLTQTSAIQFTYFHFNNSASLNATPASPNQFFVDAYTDRANFGQSILSNSSINLNAFDLDYVGRYTVGGGRLNLRPAAGARWATIRQHNDNTVTDPTLGVLGVGTFNTHFTGFGPHFSLLGQAKCQPNSPFSFIARGATSILVGGFNNTSGATFTGVAGADQSAHRTLTVPVLEAELGAAWQPTDNLMFSAGWLWQAWFDLGVSGGTTYGGHYAENDATSIMAFDGLFLRGLWRY